MTTRYDYISRATNKSNRSVSKFAYNTKAKDGTIGLNKRSKYTGNFKSLQTDAKFNFGSASNRKVKVSLARVKFMEGEE